MDYKQINKESWNKRVESHVKSDFYNVDEFLKGNSSLNEPELKLLGDIRGKSVLHLQCHFGQDSISLARMGAKVTGVDISEKGIHTAQELNKKCETDATFVVSDIYDLPNHLDQQFDIVFTSYGTIGWLPDVNKWAVIVNQFLKKGGRFVFAEFHPVVWMFDDNFNEIKYDYFTADPIIETSSGTYANQNAPIEVEEISWNHSLGEVLSALINESLKIESFEEFNYSPYNCFNGMKEMSPGSFYIEKFGTKLPLMYALSAVKT